jgi:hypothetical protein
MLPNVMTDVDIGGAWPQAFKYVSSVKSTSDNWPNDLRIKQPLNVMTETPRPVHKHTHTHTHTYQAWSRCG